MGIAPTSIISTAQFRCRSVRQNCFHSFGKAWLKKDFYSAIDLKKIKWMLRTHIGSHIQGTMKFLRAIPTQQLILIIIRRTRIKIYWRFYKHKNRIKIKSLHLAHGMRTIVF